MRTRDGIWDDIDRDTDQRDLTVDILEVLLDIRDLLTPKDVEPPTP